MAARVLLRADREDVLMPIRIVGRVLFFSGRRFNLVFGWYVIWILPVVAVLDDSPLRRLTCGSVNFGHMAALIYNLWLLAPKAAYGFLGLTSYCSHLHGLRLGVCGLLSS